MKLQTKLQRRRVGSPQLSQQLLTLLLLLVTLIGGVNCAWAATDYVWTFDTYATSVSADVNGKQFTKDASLQTDVSTVGDVTLKYIQGGATESYIYGAYASTEVFGTTATSYIYMGGAGGAGSRSFLIDHQFTGSAILTVAYKSNGGNYLSVFDNDAKSKELASVALTKSSSYAEYSVEIPDLNNTKLLFTTSSKSEILAVKLTVNEAYNYTVVPKAGGTALGENLASGVFAEGSNPIQVWYPFGYLSGSTLHYKNQNGSNPRYAVTFTPNVNNFEQEVNYDKSVNNVFYYSEVEKVSGAISVGNSSYAAGGQMGRFINGQYHALKTLVPGKYKIYGRAHCGNGSGTYTYSFKAGDKEVHNGTLTNSSVNQNIESSEFFVTENTELSLQHVGGSGTGIDYVYVQYIEGLNIVTQPVASATGYFSGVAAEPLSVTAASYGKTLTYQWYRNTTNSATGGSAFSSSASCFPETTSAGTTYYYCVVSDGTNNVKTDVVKVVVQPKAYFVKSLVLPENSGSVILAYNSNGQEIVSGSYVAENTTVKATAIPADGYKFDKWDYGTSSTENPLVYTLNKDMTNRANFIALEAPTITTHPTGETYEAEATAAAMTVAATANNGGELSYQWYVSNNSDGSAGVAISGATSASYTPSTEGSGTTYVYCVVTETVNTINAKGSVSTRSDLATLVIQNGKAKTNIYAYLTATEGQANESNCTLEFYNKNNQKQNLPSGKESKDSQDNTYYQKTFSDNANYFKVIPTGCVFEVGDEITVYIYANGTNCGYKLGSSSTAYTKTSVTKNYVYPISHTLVAADIESDGSVKIFRESSNSYFAGFSATLKRDPAAPTITTQPAGGEIGIGDKHVMTIAASGAPAPTYQWYSNTTNSNDGGTLIEGATEATYAWQTTEATAQSNYYFYCLVSNSEGSVKSNAVTVSVSKKPAIISVKDGEDKDVTSATVLVAEMGTLNVSSTSTATINVVNSNDEVASVSLVDGVLYIVANKAGSTTVTLSQAENATSLAATDKVIPVKVNKHTLTLTLKSDSDTSYEHNNTTSTTTGSYASLALTAKDENDQTVNIEGLNVIYVSDDASIVGVSKNASNQPTLSPNSGQGIAHIIASVEESNYYKPAKAEFSYKITSGFLKKIEEDITVGEKPLFNSYQEVKDASSNLLLTARFGGYKYSSATSTTKYNDTWGRVQKYTGPGEAKIRYVDDVVNSSQADNDSRSEVYNFDGVNYSYNGRIDWYPTSEKNVDGVNYGQNERIKPFSLPCRGAYMKFEPEQNGILTAYILQNGNINFKHEQENTIWYDGELDAKSKQQTPLAGSPRIYYWFDQDGYRIDPVSVTVKQPLTIGLNGGASDPGGAGEEHRVWQSKKDLESILNTWIINDPDLEVLKTSWGSQAEIDANLAKANPTPQRIIEYKGGYTLLQKAYVKYVIKVVAGRSYYFFSNGSKLGFAGANFEPSTETNQSINLVKPGGGTLTASVSSTTKELTQSDNAIEVMKPTGATIDGYETVTLARTFKVNTWNTICLPFHVTEKQVEKVFGTGTKLMIYNGLEGTKAHFLQHVDQNILAGQPYFIYPTGTGATVTEGKVGDANGKITFHNVCVDPTLAVKSYGNNKFETEDEANYEFVGTLAQESVVKGSYYVNATTGVLTRYAGDSPTTLNTYRAYLKPTAANHNLAKISDISFASFEEEPGDITGLEEYLVNEMGVEIAPAKGVFNIAGVKVADSTKGLPAGIYIVNGKTITIK